MNLSVPIPSFIGGVSQQVRALRLPSQCQELVNGWPSVVSGLGKRPASQLRADMISAAAADLVGQHFIDSGPTEKFFVLANSTPGLTAYQVGDGIEQDYSDIGVSNWTGKLVMNAADFDYLNGATQGDLRFLTVQDTTFVVNRKKQVAMLADTTPEDEDDLLVHAYFYVKSCGNDVSYKVNMEGNGGTDPLDTTIVTWDNTGSAARGAWKLTIDSLPVGTTELQITVYNAGANVVSINSLGGLSIAEIANKLKLAVDAVNDVGATGSGNTVRIFQTASATTPSNFEYKVGAGPWTPVPGTNYTLAPMLGTTSAVDVASELGVQINANRSGFMMQAEVNGPVVKITGYGGPAWSGVTKFDWSDSLANTAWIGINREVERVEDLPPICTDGYVVKVSAFQGEDADDYYVKFVANDGAGAFGKGRWVEAIKPGIQYKLDPDTMPHLLTWNGSVFAFAPATWDDSLVGDEDSNPAPSLVGQYIHDVFFSNGRLGFIAGPHVVMSEVNRYYNLWRTTVRQLLDGDPIDISVQDSQETTLCHAIPWDSEIILFSQHSQFAVGGQPLLTPKTVSSKVIGRWDSEQHVRPVLAQNSILFVSESNGFCQVWELYRMGDSSYFNASEISQEVPKYIRGMPTNLVVSLMGHMMVLQTDDDPTTVYLYKWHLQGNEKVQSAWSKLQFHGPVAFTAFDKLDLWSVVERPVADGSPEVRLSSTLLSWDPEQVDPGAEWSVLLDEKIHSDRCGTKTYSALNDETTILLPMDVDPSYFDDVVAVTAPSGTQEAGNGIPVIGGVATVGTYAGGHSITLSGDWRTEPFWLGFPINFRYVYSQPTLQEIMRDSNRTLRDGLWRVDRGIIEFENSGHFQVTVSLPGRDDSTVVWNDWAPGNWDLNTYFGESGVIQFPVLGLATETEAEITSDSWLPLYLVAGEWHGFYTSRISRLQ